MRWSPTGGWSRLISSLLICTPPPLFDTSTFRSISQMSISVARAVSVWPLAVTVQTSFFLPVPVLRHVHPEEEVVLARIEVRRLAAIRGPGLEAVLGADGDAQLLDMVPVQVPEHHVEAAVGHAFPSFVDGHDRLPGVEPDVELGRLRLRDERPRSRTGQRRRGNHDGVNPRARRQSRVIGAARAPSSCASRPCARRTRPCIPRR